MTLPEAIKQASNEGKCFKRTCWAKETIRVLHIGDPPYGNDRLVTSFGISWEPKPKDWEADDWAVLPYEIDTEPKFNEWAKFYNSLDCRVRINEQVCVVALVLAASAIIAFVILELLR